MIQGIQSQTRRLSVELFRNRVNPSHHQVGRRKSTKSSIRELILHQTFSSKLQTYHSIGRQTDTELINSIGALKDNTRHRRVAATYAKE